MDGQNTKEKSAAKQIKWLHVSDIHLNKQDVDTRRMRKKLLEYLKEN